MKKEPIIVQGYHVPVMLGECLNGLNINPDGVYVDVTFGGGGHSKAILEKLGPNGKLVAFDQDEDAMANIVDDPRFIFVRSNFRYLSNFLKYHNIEQVDGILADLGVSSHHFDDEERGFSFRFDGELDMRMNKRASKSAADIINEYSEEQLADVIYLYGEIKQSRRIAKAIVAARANQRIATIAQLLDVVKPFFPREREKKELARLFQAFRIEVNQEMEVLRQLLNQSVSALSDNGRLVIMTYHSLEDRLVKNFMKCGNFEGQLHKDFYGNIIAPLQVINNKVITASDEELVINPRSRSAKLRVAEKRSER